MMMGGLTVKEDINNITCTIKLSYYQEITAHNLRLIRENDNLKQTIDGLKQQLSSKLPPTSND
jgi:hypothetical protein